MSRTACCFLALGISVAAFAAACGDDSGDGGTGGSGGNGASGGSGGTGEAGSAGAAGSGQAGSAGTAGTGSGNGGAAGRGNGGTGGSSAGTAGTGNAGTAGTGTVVTDAGPDSGSEPDSGVVAPPDAGPAPDGGVNGDCNFGAGVGNINSPNNQDVVIAHVVFNTATTATVVLRVVAAGGFTFGGGEQLCWGATDAECSEVDDGVQGDAPVNTELSVVIGTADSPVTADEGEVLFANDFATANPGITFAYLNWGNHVSADPAGAAPTLETLAGGFWTPGDSVGALTGTQNAIFVNGDTTVETGFGVCTATEF